MEVQILDIGIAGITEKADIAAAGDFHAVDHIVAAIVETPEGVGTRTTGDVAGHTGEADVGNLQPVDGVQFIGVDPHTFVNEALSTVDTVAELIKFVNVGDGIGVAFGAEEGLQFGDEDPQTGHARHREGEVGPSMAVQVHAVGSDQHCGFIPGVDFPFGARGSGTQCKIGDDVVDVLKGGAVDSMEIEGCHREAGGGV